MTSRWCWPTARCCSRLRRSPASWPEDRYIAADAIELVEVDYEDLPVIVDPFEALTTDVVLREDLDAAQPGAHGPRRHHTHIFLWEEGNEEATNQAMNASEVVAEEMVYYHRTHPCPLETCGASSRRSSPAGRSSGSRPGWTT